MIFLLPNCCFSLIVRMLKSLIMEEHHPAASHAQIVERASIRQLVLWRVLNVPKVSLKEQAASLLVLSAKLVSMKTAKGLLRANLATREDGRRPLARLHALPAALGNPTIMRGGSLRVRAPSAQQASSKI